MLLHTERSGTGQPVIFIHGWQNDTKVWGSVIEALDGEAHCIAVDLPGHGGSSDVPDLDEYERDAVLRSLEAVIDSCEMPPILVGHSLGGFLSLSYAATRPGRISGLVLVGAGPGYRSDGPRNEWNEWVANNANPKAPPGQERICMQHDSLVIDALPDLDMPTAIVIGERDASYHASVAVFAGKMPNTSTHQIADAGHMVHVKKPVEVAHAVRDVIAAVDTIETS